MGATVGSTADASAVSTGHRGRAGLARNEPVVRGGRSLSAEVVQHRLLRVRQRHLRQHRVPVADPAAGRRRQDAGRPGDHVAEGERRGVRPGEHVAGAGADQLRRRAHLRVRALAASGTCRSAWPVQTEFTYLHAADRATGAPPNIEGGTPAPDGYLKVRYMRPSGRAGGSKAYLHAAARQTRLSTLDLEDRRTGATRTTQRHQELLLRRRDGAGLGVAGSGRRGGQRRRHADRRRERRWRRCRRASSARLPPRRSTHRSPATRRSASEAGSDSAAAANCSSTSRT